MLTIVIIKNPFNISEKEIHFSEWQDKKTVLEYCDEYSKQIAKLQSQDAFIYSLNGKAVSTNTIPTDGDYIALCPVVGKSFKNVLGIVALVALAVFAPGIGTATAAAMGLTGTAAIMVGGLITAGVVMIGGWVINKTCHLFPDASSMKSDISTASTYSWDKATSGINQGVALAVTYGTYLTAGTVLSRHIKIVNDDQYLILLLTGGQGPIDAITDIKINDMPIATYADVTYHCEGGFNNPGSIYFLEGKAYADQTLSYELLSDGDHNNLQWCYAITEGNRGSGVEIIIEFPQGLYQIDSETGDVAEAWCFIHLEGREISDEEYANNYNVRNYSEWYHLESILLKESKTSAFSKSFTYDGFGNARFAVRVAVVKDAPSQYFVNKCIWTQLSHIITGNFVRPGKVLVALKIKATNQLSGNVNVTWLQTRHMIWAYDPHVGTYVAKPATNPAWAAYDMIHGARPIQSKPVVGVYTYSDTFVYDGIAAEHIDYDAFAEWAYRCDMWKLSFNYIFSSSENLWDALKIPEAVGLGKVLVRGTKITCIYDHVSDPVQLFTVANINENSFSIDYLPMLDRANAIEVSFVNKLKNYQKDIVAVYTQDYNEVGIVQNPSQLSLEGCVTAEQALRYAMYHLNQNHYLTRTCTFDVDIDSLACTLGDQILVQHDLPLWGYGGVIIDYDENTNKVVLDQEITFEVGITYQILCRVTDSSSQDSATAEQLEYKTITNFESLPTTNIIYISSPFSCIPQYGDVWAIGQLDKVAKPFTIISIERKSDLQATLVCVEYEPNSMNDQYTDIDKVNYSHLDLASERTKMQLENTGDF